MRLKALAAAEDAAEAAPYVALVAFAFPDASEGAGALAGFAIGAWLLADCAAWAGKPVLTPNEDIIAAAVAAAV